MRTKGQKNWTEEEREYLRQNYLSSNIETVCEFLGRNEREVKRVATKQLGLVVRETKGWSEQEISILQTVYPEHGVNETCKLLNRSRYSVWKKAGLLKLSHPLYNGYEEISGAYWKSLIYGANLRNISFDVKIEECWSLFIKQNRLCALSGVQLVFEHSRSLRSQQTASLDRIDSKKCYTIDNLQWIHKSIQRMKNNSNESDFIEMCHKISAYRKDK